ncbi:hypothetical protein CPC08DRAFT_771501 [Agrocybe pediades]|nr:hypothetical protein CPC08DRAFT_771501 [Agrocybe pediades]
MSYTSSEAVLNSISLAHSSSSNPRGLECVWNAPYLHTLMEIFKTHPESSANFLVNAPYSLWLPSYFKKVEDLRRDLADIGLDYDNLSSSRACFNLARAYCEKNNLSKATTDREVANEKKANAAAKERLKEKVTRLRDEALELKAIREEIFEG